MRIEPEMEMAQLWQSLLWSIILELLLSGIVTGSYTTHLILAKRLRSDGSYRPE